MDNGQEVTKQGFPLDVLDKLMVCEVNEPVGVILALGDVCWPFEILPFNHTLSSPGISYTFRHICLEPSCCLVAENGLGAELVSGCGVVSAWTEDLHPCFVWVLNMLDCIIHGHWTRSDQTGFPSRSAPQADGM